MVSLDKFVLYLVVSQYSDENVDQDLMLVN